MSSSGGIGGWGAGGGIQQIMAMRQQLIDKSQLLQGLNPTEGAGAAAPAKADGPAGGFSNALQSALENVSQTQNKAEDVTAAYERGHFGAPPVVNIHVRDAESFRQSRTQVASDIARAVAFGRRGM